MKKIISFVLVLGLSAILPGCIPRQSIRPGAETKEAPRIGPRDRLFPLGIYHHEINLVIARNPDVLESKEVKADFSGVVKLKPDAVQMVALSSFGTTVFKINEDLKTGAVKAEIFVPEMKKFEPKILEYYSILRLLLLASLVHEATAEKLQWTQTGALGLPLVLETVGFEKTAVFSFTKYDHNGVPIEVAITHPNFKVTVKVSSYEI